MRWRGNERKVGKHRQFLILMKERRINHMARSHRGPGESCILSFQCHCYRVLLADQHFSLLSSTKDTCSAAWCHAGKLPFVLWQPLANEPYLCTGSGIMTILVSSSQILYQTLMTPFWVPTMLSSKSCSPSFSWQRGGAHPLFNQNSHTVLLHLIVRFLAA